METFFLTIGGIVLMFGIYKFIFGGSKTHQDSTPPNHYDYWE